MYILLCPFQEGVKLAPVSEAEVRAAFSARLGMPLTGQIMPGNLPFYPTLPGEFFKLFSYFCMMHSTSNTVVLCFQY